MALDPDTASEIVRLVLSTIAPFSIAGMAIGIVAGTVISYLMGTRIVVPRAERVIIGKMTDPEGEIQKLRGKEREATMLEVREELDAADAGMRLLVADLKASIPKVPDYSGELAAIKASIPVVPDYSADLADLKALKADFRAFRGDCAPLLATFTVAGEDGKPEAVNQIVAALSAVQRAADAAMQACYIEIETEPGKKEFVPVGPNLKHIVVDAIVEYAASEKGKEMQVLSMDAKDRQALADLATAQEYAAKLQDPQVRAQMAQGAELKEMEDLLKDILVGDGTKKGMMSEQRFNRMAALARQRGIGEPLGGAASGGGGGAVQRGTPIGR